MPCNQTGFTNASLAAKFGIVDFDWSNAKGAWANASPMDCEERLVTQAAMVKKINPNSHVFVYRNLVKALPWYTSVREKILDPQYSGWFLPFKPNAPSYHVPNCSTDASGTKCSRFYHDQEQTPRPSADTGPTRTKQGAWYIYNNTNDVSGLHPGWKTITSGGAQPTWEACRDAADQAKRKIFTWWESKNAQCGTCWFSSEWNTTRPSTEPHGYLPTAESGHVTGTSSHLPLGPGTLGQ